MKVDIRIFLRLNLALWRAAVVKPPWSRSVPKRAVRGPSPGGLRGLDSQPLAGTESGGRSLAYSSSLSLDQFSGSTSSRVPNRTEWPRRLEGLWRSVTWSTGMNNASMRSVHPCDVAVIYRRGGRSGSYGSRRKVGRKPYHAGARL